MCRVDIYHNWCKCGGLESLDRLEYDCEDRDRPDHLVKETTFDIRNIPDECQKCEDLRLQEEEERRKKQEEEVKKIQGELEEARKKKEEEEKGV
jgi:hypothetical protein